MRDRAVEKRDLPQYLAGGGCLLSIPVVIALGFRSALTYAQKKEHQFSHQVEEVELEGDAAIQLEGKMSPKDALQNFVQRLERTTEPFAKMGGRFSPADYQRQTERLESLRAKLEAQGEVDAECRTLLGRANQCLQQYAPPS